jgi:hypothetical protein
MQNGEFDVREVSFLRSNSRGRRPLTPTMLNAFERFSWVVSANGFSC